MKMNKPSTIHRNRLRLAIVKASTDNKTNDPSPRQIFDAVVALYPPDDKMWGWLCEVAVSYDDS